MDVLEKVISFLKYLWEYIRRKGEAQIKEDVKEMMKEAKKERDLEKMNKRISR
jgi:hypothetical protein